MILSFKLALFGGAMCALPLFVLEPTAGPQDPAPKTAVATAGGDFMQEARWNFAELHYVSTNGEKRTIAARRMTKLWILRRPDGGIYLEILDENSDYSFVEIREFHIIRRSATVSSVDVTVVRSDLTQMAFPGFR